MSKYEYRVIWKRKGKSKRAKIYQTLPYAESLLTLLAASHSDEPPDDIGHSVGETAVDWSDAELERWQRMTAPFEINPILEVREVSAWRKLHA